MNLCLIYTTFAFLASCLCVRATNSGNYIALSSEEVPSQSSSTQLPRRRRALKAASGRIAYGQQVPDGEFPFVVYIDANGAICTGSVISPRVILTGGHCIFRQETYTFVDKTKSHVYLGSSQRASQFHAGAIKKFFVPEKYDPDLSSCYGDVGLIELAEPIPSSIKPVALANDATEMPADTTLTVVGWGRMENGMLPSNLMSTTGSVMPTAECKRVHEALFDYELSDDHFCVGVPQDTMQTTCGGDSGGPYLITNPGEEDPVQVGGTSFGPSGDCGAKMVIDVPFKVSYWRSWIDDTLGMHNLRGTSAPKRLNVPRYKECYSGGTVLSTKNTTTCGKCLEMCRRRDGTTTEACKAWTWKKIGTDKESIGGVCTLLTSQGEVKKSNRCTSGYFVINKTKERKSNQGMARKLGKHA